MDDTTLQLIQNYQTPQVIIDRLHNIHAIILTGITGAGKDTIIKDMVAAGGFTRVVTSTTRAPRENDGVLEQHGREYYFLSMDEAKEKIKNGEYIEVANVHGRINGSLISEYERIDSSGETAVAQIDYQGAQAFLDFGMPNLLVLFIVPPSFDVWIERLTGRHGGSLEGEKDEIIARFRSAEKELAHALSDPRFIPIMNDLSIESAAEIIEYSKTGTRPSSEQIDQAHQVIRDLADAISVRIKELES